MREGGLTAALCRVALALEGVKAARQAEFRWFKSHWEAATKQDLREVERRIMSAISEFASKQNQFNARLGAAVDGAVGSITGLTGDIQTLNDKITELQESGGQITPADQALLDELSAMGEGLATKSEALAAALAALDNLTPPKPPAG